NGRRRRDTSTGRNPGQRRSAATTTSNAKRAKVAKKTGCSEALRASRPLRSDVVGLPPSRPDPALQCPPMPAAERIAGWMRRYLAGTGARGFVVGLSGGVDSAVVARLAQLAAPGAVVG